MRVIAPFLPLPPENIHHQAMADFDWIGATRMMMDSVTRSCRCPVHVVTDVSVHLPLPALQYPTRHRRLMLWVLESYIKYIESTDFDQDTVVLDCDQLVYANLSQFFVPHADLGLLIRPTHKHRDTWKKLLNGVQFWSVRGKERLLDFFQRALVEAEGLSDDLIRWGADTAAIRNLIEPIQLGMQDRAGIRLNLMEYSRVLEALSEDDITRLRKGIAPRPLRAVMDFRYQRKLHMRQVYEMTVAKEVVCT